MLVVKKQCYYIPVFIKHYYCNFMIYNMLEITNIASSFKYGTDCKHFSDKTRKFIH